MSQGKEEWGRAEKETGAGERCSHGNRGRLRVEVKTDRKKGPIEEIKRINLLTGGKRNSLDRRACSRFSPRRGKGEERLCKNWCRGLEQEDFKDRLTNVSRQKEEGIWERKKGIRTSYKGMPFA